MTAEILATRDESVLVLRLARPEKENALTGAMYLALIEAFAGADRDEDIRAILITGSGGNFTAGNDLSDFLAYAAESEAPPPFQFVRALAMLETPLVAAIEGVAVGIGTTLMLHCDLVYAAPSAAFRMPFVDLGLVPEAGSTYLLPRRIGQARATELLMLGEGFGAEEAQRLGLVNAVVPAEDLVAHATSRAKAFAAKPASALKETRALMRRDRSTVLSVIDAEAEAFQAAMRSPEARAAFEAFLSRPRASAS
jgi:enoyl-CoA hydratase/carnithine racemase